MPWYKAGTVSVVQNSNAVTGTNTAFIANSRVGDAFLGPDGRWYEVTNIASDTAMSISPSYQGANSSAGDYALAPMQGYVKQSADALRALVNQFGGVLAVLGTEPTVAGVRTALNLSDTGGLIEGSNKYYTDTRVRSAVLTGLVTSDAATVVATDALLVAIGKLQAQASGKAAKGANNDITSLLGLTTALSVAQGGTGNSNGMAQRIVAGAMLGAVSQSGGVPNGAIVETATNANGTYTKLLDGTLICQGPMADFAVAANAIATVSSPATFPALFINANYFFEAKGAPSASNDVYGFMGHNSKTTSGATAIYRNGSAAQSITNCRYLAVGRWFT